jgi:uncharacterized protein
MEAVLQEKLQLVVIAFFLALIAFLIAWRCGFYHYNSAPRQTQVVKFYEVLIIFALFLISMLLIAPALAMAFFSWQSGQWIHLREANFNAIDQGWANVLAIIVTAVILLLFNVSRSSETKKAIWGDSNALVKNLLFGGMTWLICYPIVVVIDQAIEIIGVWKFHLVQHEQVAVRYLKMVMDDPRLFLTMGLLIIFLVPIIEELLFRGFLQTWLCSWLSRGWSIIITAIVFALFHFSSSQGAANLELLISLFVLACFLGFLYERQKSLWASIGLHMTFNGISVLAILFNLTD